ncbi:MAG: alpha/beta fold hydrolase [Novosphingobium sp.]
MFVEVGGIEQWLEIEGDGEKPVLLLEHGGPGASTRLANGGWMPWQKHFMLVHWDQRGAGRTYQRNGPENCHPMTFAQGIADGLGIAEFVHPHLKTENLFVLGHSWGSVVAAHMLKRCPHLFLTFTETGMLVNFKDNEDLNYAKLPRLRHAHRIPGSRIEE